MREHAPIETADGDEESAIDTLDSYLNHIRWEEAADGREPPLLPPIEEAEKELLPPSFSMGEYQNTPFDPDEGDDSLEEEHLDALRESDAMDSFICSRLGD